MKRIGESYRADRNAITLLRLLLAACVILYHSWPLGGIGLDPIQSWSSMDASIGYLAVGGFFSLSGFLLAQSLARDPSPWRYLVRRTARIFPAYWLCLAVCALFIGPLAWRLAGEGAVAGYFASGEPVTYVLKNAGLVVFQRGIAGIFANNPYPFDVNGSLWTLKFEFACYVLLLAFHRLGMLDRRRMFLVMLLTVLLIANQVEAATGMRVPDLPLFFFAGSLAFLYRERLPHSGWLAAGALVCAVATMRFGLFKSTGAPLVTYLVTCAAISLPFRNLVDDYSYGCYLYGFPVQQTLAAMGVHLAGRLPFLLVSLGMALLLAAASWHLLEKRVLSVARAALSRRAGRA